MIAPSFFLDFVWLVPYTYGIARAIQLSIGQNMKSVKVIFKTTEQGRNAINAQAAKERRTSSELMRQAIEEYLKRAGVTVDLRVEHGGDRTK